MKEVRQLMGMPVSIEVVGSGPMPSRGIAEAFAHLERIDQEYSTYKPESPVSRLSRGEITLEACSAELRNILEECDRLREATGGYFNATRPDGRIDPSGLVKGWAIRGASTILESYGIWNHCVEAGGDIQVGGHNAQGLSWQIGIRHPIEQGRLAKKLAVSDRGIATSGTYERGFHIYDPHTGKPATELLGLTVIGPDIQIADNYATAAFAMGRSGIEFLARQEGIEAYAIDASLDVIFTAGFEEYIAP